MAGDSPYNRFAAVGKNALGIDESQKDVLTFLPSSIGRPMTLNGNRKRSNGMLMDDEGGIDR